MKDVVTYQAHPWGQLVFFTQSDKALKKLGATYNLPLDREDCLGLCWNTSGPYIIWVKQGEGAAILAHECGHVVLEILGYVGADPRQANGEPFCYTLQRMLETFLPHLLPPIPKVPSGPVVSLTETTIIDNK